MTFNFRQSLNTINKGLKQHGFCIEKTFLGKFILLKEYKDSYTSWQDYGVYCKKKTVIDVINQLLKEKIK